MLQAPASGSGSMPARWLMPARIATEAVFQANRRKPSMAGRAPARLLCAVFWNRTVPYITAKSSGKNAPGLPLQSGPAQKRPAATAEPCPRPPCWRHREASRAERPCSPLSPFAESRPVAGRPDVHRNDICPGHPGPPGGARPCLSGPLPGVDRGGKFPSPFPREPRCCLRPAKAGSADSAN